MIVNTTSKRFSKIPFLVKNVSIKCYWNLEYYMVNLPNRSAGSELRPAGGRCGLSAKNNVLNNNNRWSRPSAKRVFAYRGR